jgi:hypothetical protein
MGQRLNTQRKNHARKASNGAPGHKSLDREWSSGASSDDVGFVEIDRAEIADQKADIPWSSQNKDTH